VAKQIAAPGIILSRVSFGLAWVCKTTNTAPESTSIKGFLLTEKTLFYF
jgi:hypothetical protein